MSEGPKQIRLGGSVVELDAGVILAADGARTELRPKTATLLRALSAQPGVVVSKDALIDEVWPGLAVDDDGIVQCVGEIRRALGPLGRDALRTHARRGYSLHPDAAPAEQQTRLPAVRAIWARGGAIVIGLLVAATLASAATVALFRAPGEPSSAAAPVPGSFARHGPTVAVLPFVALTSGERWELLARALTQDVISDLAQNSWVHVLGEATSRALPTDDPVAAARRLGVDYVASGSIQVEGDRARVAANLSDAKTGRQIWSKRFEGAAAALLTLQLQASEAIVGELAANWSGPIARAEKAEARGKGVVDLTAYELYLKAGEELDGYSQEDISAAIDLLKQAVAQAPTFGEAWAKLSLASYNLVSPQMSQTEIETLWEQGHAAALEAYRVSPNAPSALAQAANVVRWDDQAKAERMVRRAAALAPNNADTLAYLAFRASHFPALGREAIGWIERAVALNPDAPNWYDWNRGAVLMVLGRYAEAADAYADAPDHIAPRAGRIAALALAGEDGRAREQMSALLREFPSFTSDWYADAEGLHPDVAAIYASGFDAARPAER